LRTVLSVVAAVLALAWAERASSQAIDTTFPDTDAVPQDMVVSGNTLYVVGYFSSIGGISRPGIAAIDRRNGNVTPWVPDSTRNGFLIAARDGRVFIQQHNGITAIDSTSGRVLWRAVRYEICYSMVVSDTTLCAGYWWASGHNNIVAYDVRTGAERWSQPAGGSPMSPDANVYGVSACGGHLFVNGNFRWVGIKYCLAGTAKLDAATGLVLQTFDWTYDYFNQSTSTSRGALIGWAGLFFIDDGTDVVHTWLPSGSGAVYKLTAAGGRVFAGGQFLDPDGSWRWELISFDEASGARLHWDPGLWGFPEALAADADRVYVGGDYSNANGAHRNLTAIFVNTPLTNVSSPAFPHGVSLYPPIPNPMSTKSQVVFILPDAETVSVDVIDLAGRHVASPLATSTLPAGRHEIGLDRRDLKPGVFWIRLSVGRQVAAVQKLLVLQ
jgi:trimeric autotransporter adhesin